MGDDTYLLYKSDTTEKRMIYEREGDADDKNILLSYGTDWESIPKISFVDVYNHAYNPALVKNKIVLIGSTATALKDTFSVPLHTIPGVLLHAETIKTAL